MAEHKTNAMRMLDRAGICYRTLHYDPADGKIDGISVADKIGRPVEQVYKTLVLRGASQNIYIFCIGVANEIDLKKAARAVDEKSVSMVHVDEINRLTGYIRGGCSPVGMKKEYRTTFDEPVLQLNAVVVSGGKIGTQIEVVPGDLIVLLKAGVAPIAAVSEGL